MPDLLERLTTALVDRYAIKSEIGRGGMATVFLAEDLKHHRQVAIKVMNPAISSDVATERFFREIEIVAGLTHPHILPLYDSGQADGLLYCVMPYIEGESLLDLLQRERQLPVEDALQITGEVAEALDYAHHHGIIHRDIKPANILLEGGHAVVADFGIARAVQEAGGERITQTGVAVGTPAYMSPEQATGEHVLDGRTDIYALGCVLYEILAGDPPFTGATPQVVMKRHSMDPVPSLRTARDTAPESVECAIQKAMAKVPADRYRTAAEFVEALEAPPPRKASRTRSKRVALLAAGVAAAAAAGYWLSQGPLSSPVQPEVHVVLADPEVQVDDPVLGQVVQTGLEIALLAAPSISAVLEEDVEQAYEAIGLAPDAPLDRPTALDVAARSGAAGVLQAELRRLGTGSLIVKATLLAPDGSTRVLVQRQAAADDVLISAVDSLSLDLRGELGESAASLAESQSLLFMLTPSTEAARLYVEARDAAQAANELQAIELLEQAVVLDPDFAYAWGMLGVLRQNWFGDYLEAFERSFELLDRLLPHQRPMYEAGYADLVARDYRTAIRISREAIDNPPRDSRGDPDYPETQFGLMTLEYLELGEPVMADSTLTEHYRYMAEGLATGYSVVNDLNHGMAKAHQSDWEAAVGYIRAIYDADTEGFGPLYEAFIAAAAGRWVHASEALGDPSAWPGPVYRYMAGTLLGTFEAVRGRPRASRDAFIDAADAAHEIGSPFLSLAVPILRADAEFFALSDPQRASAQIADYLEPDAPEVGLARRYHAKLQALAAAICTRLERPVAEGLAARLPCDAEVVTDSLRDTIETLEALGWKAIRDGRFNAAVRIGTEPLLGRAGGPGLRARAPTAAAFEALAESDSAAAIYRAIARSPFGWITNAPSAIVMRSYALRRLARMGGAIGDSAAAVLREDWADAEPEFLARVAEPLIDGRQ